MGPRYTMGEEFYVLAFLIRDISSNWPEVDVRQVV